MKRLAFVAACAAIALISFACKRGDSPKSDLTKTDTVAEQAQVVTQAPRASDSLDTVVSAMPPPPKEVVGSLDGIYFEGMVGGQADPDGGHDIANFYDGMFTTSYLRGQGLKPALYSIQPTDSITTFHAEWHDPNLGTLSWDGKIKGDSLTSTGVYAPLTGDSVKYWWDGVASSVDSITARHLATKRGVKPAVQSDATKPR